MPEFIDLRGEPSWMRDINKDRQTQMFQMGYQGAQRQRELDEEKRQFDAMLPLNQKLKEQELAINSINITNALRNQQEKIASEKAFSKLAELMASHKLAGIAGTDASEARLWQTIANNPEFYVHDKARDFLMEMRASKTSREKADQLEESAINRAAIVAEQQEAQTLRKKMEIEGRKDVAETRSQADIDKANIAAKAKVDVATIAASKWKDHSRFAAFKDASKSIALSIDPAKEPEKWADAIGKAYNEILPSGEPNAWDSVPSATPALAPIDPMPKSRAEMDAIPSGTWYINPADGKRYRKK